MFERDISNAFHKVMQQYPVVTLTGPRQSGKTTFVRNAVNNKPYFNLEEPDTKARIMADPRTFFLENKKGAILDEIQHAPQLMSYIQSLVDETQTLGAFILTGSNQFQLNHAITQSLAGRAALLELLPLSIAELSSKGIELSADDYLLKGFYPAIYDRNLDPSMAYKNYAQTYLERDVRQLINVRNLSSFRNFLQLTAGRIGSLLNTENLANDVGMAHNTIRQWLSILETSYILYRLQPYFENFGKRIIKSPKVYFTDVGMISYLLGIENVQQLKRDPLRGGLFENLVLLELLKTQFNAGKEPRFYYYRDSNQNEIDLIIKHANYLIPIEIKSTATFHPSMLKNLKFFKKLVKERMPKGFLVYSGEEQYIGEIELVHFKNSRKIIENITRNL